jgi:hypothetical protein
MHGEKGNTHVDEDRKRQKEEEESVHETEREIMKRRKHP